VVFNNAGVNKILFVEEGCFGVFLALFFGVFCLGLVPISSTCRALPGLGKSTEFYVMVCIDAPLLCWANWFKGSREYPL